MLGSFALLVVLSLLFWNRALRSKADLAAAEHKAVSAHLNAILANVPGVVYRMRLTPTARELTYLSEAFERQYGLPAERFMSMSLAERLEMVHPDDRQAFAARWKVMNVEGEIVSRARFIRPDGQVRWFEYHEHMVERRGDELIAEGLVLDVTKEVEAEQALDNREKLLSAITRQAPSAVVLIDDETLRFAEFNDAACRDLGYSREEFEKINLSDVADVSGNHLEQRNKEIDINGSTSLEMRHRRKDGSYQEVQVNVTRIEIDGRPHYVAIWTDIGQRKRLEEDLQRREQEFRTLAENSPDPIFRYDRTYRRLYTNPSASKVSGKPIKEIIGGSPMDVVGLSAEHRKKVSEAIRTVFESGEIQHIEVDYTSPYAQSYSFHMLLAPECDAEGQVVTVLALARDITEIRKQQEERRRLEIQIEDARKLDSLGRLAGGIAHDFNNILGAISGYARFISEDTPETSPTQKYAKRILSSSKRGREIVDQILTFSRRKNVETTRFPLAQVVNESLALLHIAIPSSINLTVDIASPDAVVEGNQNQIGQALMNLCFNARDALNDETGTIAIGVRTLPEDTEPETPSDAQFFILGQRNENGSYVELSVEDNGTGISAEVLHQLFDPFFTTKEVGKGTGLGLSVVHGVAVNHGGVITVRSRQGAGTKFCILFPRVESTDTENDPTQPDRPPSPALKYERQNAMIVDDDKDFKEMLTEQMKRHGWHVTDFNCPIAAYEAFSSEPTAWDIVITDQTMPKLRGQDLIDKIQSITPDIPCILCTGYDEKLVSKAVGPNGNMAFIQKPLEPANLTAAIAAVWRGKPTKSIVKD